MGWEWEDGATVVISELPPAARESLSRQLRRQIPTSAPVQPPKPDQEQGPEQDLLAILVANVTDADTEWR